MFIVRSHPLLAFDLGRFVLNDPGTMFRLSAQAVDPEVDRTWLQRTAPLTLLIPSSRSQFLLVSGASCVLLVYPTPVTAIVEPVTTAPQD